MARTQIFVSSKCLSPPPNYWRNYFKTAKDPNIFSVIDHAIKVAACDFPEDFSLQRDRIVARLSSVQSSRNDEESSHGGSRSIDGEVLKIKEVLENSDNEASILESLTRLKMMAMTVEILGATAIGKVVSRLKKHGSTMQIRDLARAIVDGWRVVVDEYVATQDSKQSSPDVLGKQNKNEQLEIKKQEVVDVKPKEASTNHERKMQCLNDEVAVQAKIEATKRKLHERYEQIDNAKRQRMIQVVDYVPGKGHYVGFKTPGSAQGSISEKLLKLKRTRLLHSASYTTCLCV